MPARHVTVVDAAIPVLVAAVIGVGAGLHGGASTRPWTLALGLAAAGALTARRRWPGWTLAVSGALVVVLFHLDRSAGSVAVLAPAVALYFVGLRRGRPQQIAAGVVAIAAVILADLLHPGAPSLGQTLGHAMLVAIPLLAAEVIRTHQANMKLLVERFELAEQAREREAQRRAEQERMRIARDLHDVVAHTLTEVNVAAAAAAEQAKPGHARDALERIERTSHAAIGELRAILGVLRDTDPVETPRTPAPGVDDLPDLIAQAGSTGLSVRLDTDGSAPGPISDATSLAAYRIVQESLTNARRHAPGAGVTVTLRHDTANLTVTVENGDGVTADDNAPRPGVGVIGMRERAAAIGGQLDAGPIEGGFLVHAKLPYQPTR